MTNQTAERIYKRLRQLHDMAGGAGSSQYAIDFERPGVVAMPKRRSSVQVPPAKMQRDPTKSTVAGVPTKLQGELNFD